MRGGSLAYLWHAGGVAQSNGALPGGPRGPGGRLRGHREARDGGGEELRGEERGGARGRRDGGGRSTRVRGGAGTPCKGPGEPCVGSRGWNELSETTDAASDAVTAAMRGETACEDATSQAPHR